MSNTIDASYLVSTPEGIRKQRSKKDPETTQAQKSVEAGSAGDSSSGKSDLSIIERGHKIDKRHENIENAKQKRIDDLKKPEYERSGFELPNDMFNYVTQKKAQQDEIEALQIDIPKDENHFTSEKSVQGKEVQSFFSANKSNFTDFQKKEKHKYLSVDPEDKDTAFQHIKKKKAARALEEDQFLSEIVKQRDPLNTKHMSEVGDARQEIELRQNLQNSRFQQGEDSFDRIAKDRAAKIEAEQAQVRNELKSDHKSGLAEQQASTHKIELATKKGSPGVVALDDSVKAKISFASSPDQDKLSVGLGEASPDRILNRALQENSITDSSQTVSSNKYFTIREKIEPNYNLRHAQYIKKRDRFLEELQNRRNDPLHPDRIMLKKQKEILAGEDHEFKLTRENTIYEKMLLEREEEKTVHVGKELDTRSRWFFKGDVQQIYDPNMNDKYEVRREEIFHVEADRKKARTETAKELHEKPVTKNLANQHHEKAKLEEDTQAKMQLSRDELRQMAEREMQSEMKEEQQRLRYQMEDLAKSLSVKI